MADQLSWESAAAAPGVWVPDVNSVDGPPPRASRSPRSMFALAMTSLACGALGLVVGIFGVWGAPLSLAAVGMALGARPRRRRAPMVWVFGLVTGMAGIGMSLLWLLIAAGVVAMPGG